MHDRVMDKSKESGGGALTAVERAIDPARTGDSQEPAARLQRMLGNQAAERLGGSGARASSPAAAVARAETLPEEEPTASDVAQAEENAASSAAPSGGTAVADDADVADAEKKSASFSIADGTYNDTATES